MDAEESKPIYKARQANKILDIVDIYRLGCPNTDPFSKPPTECEECTSDFLNRIDSVLHEGPPGFRLATVNVKVDTSDVLKLLGATERYLDIVFDGDPFTRCRPDTAQPPGTGHFVKVESPAGTGVRVGTWIDRGDGFWALRLTLADFLSIESPQQPQAVCDHFFHTMDLMHGYCAYCGIPGHLGADGKVLWHEGAKLSTKSRKTSGRHYPEGAALEACVYCGDSYLAHEIDAGNGLRAHRINRPDQPQHGQLHFYIPNTPEVQEICFGDLHKEAKS